MTPSDAAGAAATRSRLRRGDRRFVAAMLAPTAFFLLAFYVYPTVFNVENSFTDLDLFGLRRGGNWVGVANYLELATSADFLRVLWNTVFWLTCVGVAARIVLGFLLALLLNSRALVRWRLAGAARVLLLVPWATPPIVAIIVWRWMLDAQVGIVNRLLVGSGLLAHPIAFLATAGWIWPALILIITWNTLPLVTLTFLAALQSIPTELVEAAEVAGASRWQIVRYVYLPLLQPAIVVMVMMSTFWTFNNFVYVWLTTGAGPGLYTNVMATEVYIKAFIDGRLGYSSAVGVVMAAVMVFFGILYLRVVTARRLRETFG
jgi:multiple sugar transport system permease protein